jgi:SAM-dependent methyltransferase
LQRDLQKGSRIVEIGGAGGVTKSFNPNVIVTDIRESKNIDFVVNGENLPFENKSLDAIWAKDSIHHMLNPQQFFEEASRTLKPGGVLSICEPYWSPLGKFIYKNLHPEIWSVEEILKGKYSENGNQALAYCIFELSPEKFTFVYNNFRVQEKQIVNGLSWVLSGGATLTTVFPIKILKIILDITMMIKLL